MLEPEPEIWVGLWSRSPSNYEWLEQGAKIIDGGTGA